MIPYDTVIVPCPKCGKVVKAHSTSGQCLMVSYPLHVAPDDVLLGVNDTAPFSCEDCKVKFYVKSVCGAIIVSEWDGEEDEPVPRVKR